MVTKEEFDCIQRVATELGRILDRDLSIKGRASFTGTENYIVRAVLEAMGNVGVNELREEEEKIINVFKKS